MLCAEIEENKLKKSAGEAMKKPCMNLHEVRQEVRHEDLVVWFELRNQLNKIREDESNARHGN